jgi:hypothetical protein
VVFFFPGCGSGGRWWWRRRGSTLVDSPVENTQSAGIFQYTIHKSAGTVQYQICSQWGYSSAKYAVSRNVLVKNMQSAGIVGYSRRKYAVSRDIPVENTQVSRDIPVQNTQVSRDIPVPNMQSVGILWCKICSQLGYSSTKYAVSRDISVPNIPTECIFGTGIFL